MFEAGTITPSNLYSRADKSIVPFEVKLILEPMLLKSFNVILLSSISKNYHLI